MDLVRVIKRGKDQIGNDGQLKRGGLGRRYDMTHVTLLRNIGLEQVDFGSGAPARVIFHEPQVTMPVPTFVILPPCKGKDGVNLLSLAVKEEHADAFLGELAKLEHAVIL